MNQFSVDVGENEGASNKYRSSQPNLTGACPPVSRRNSESVALKSWALPWRPFGSLSQDALAQRAEVILFAGRLSLPSGPNQPMYAFVPT
jgi:hypothetical protein